MSYLRTSKTSQMDFADIGKFLSGELDEKERIEFLKKLDANPDDKKKFEQFKKIWDKSQGIKDFETINIDNDWVYIQSKLKPKFKLRSQKIPLSGFIIRAAAILVIAFGLAFGLYRFMNIFQKTVLITNQSTDSINEILLPDGSVVVLNKNSEIFYNQKFNKNNRELFFNGEAFFKVAANASLPFVVRTRNTTIQVVGTSFNIKDDTSAVKVTVLTGKVSLYETRNRKNHVELIKNQAASFEYATRKIIYGQNNDLNFLTWKTGRFEFFKTPTVDALTTLADYFNKKLIVKIPVKDSITGVFENQPLDEILKEIELTSAIKIENNQNYIIVRK